MFAQHENARNFLENEGWYRDYLSRELPKAEAVWNKVRQLETKFNQVEVWLQLSEVTTRLHDSKLVPYRIHRGEREFQISLLEVIEFFTLARSRRLEAGLNVKYQKAAELSLTDPMGNPFGITQNEAKEVLRLALLDASKSTSQAVDRIWIQIDSKTEPVEVPSGLHLYFQEPGGLPYRFEIAIKKQEKGSVIRLIPINRPNFKPFESSFAEWLVWQKLSTEESVTLEAGVEPKKAPFDGWLVFSKQEASETQNCSDILGDYKSQRSPVLVPYYSKFRDSLFRPSGKAVQEPTETNCIFLPKSTLPSLGGLESSLEFVGIVNCASQKQATQQLKVDGEWWTAFVDQDRKLCIRKNVEKECWVRIDKVGSSVTPWISLDHMGNFLVGYALENGIRRLANFDRITKSLLRNHDYGFLDAPYVYVNPKVSTLLFSRDLSTRAHLWTYDTAYKQSQKILGHYKHAAPLTGACVGTEGTPPRFGLTASHPDPLKEMTFISTGTEWSERTKE
jgi:hypothetical protein